MLNGLKGPKDLPSLHAPQISRPFISRYNMLNIITPARSPPDLRRFPHAGTVTCALLPPVHHKPPDTP